MSRAIGESFTQSCLRKIIEAGAAIASLQRAEALRALAADPDPTIISQLIDRGKAEVER